MSFLHLDAVAYRNDTGFRLGPISLTLEQGQKLAVAGETGSGKSTLLRLIGGLLQAESGSILLEGEIVKGSEEQLIPGHKRIAYLSQHFELRNHYRVEELLDMANKLPPEKADHIYQICRITHLLKRRTAALSGGERQRISLARLLTASPVLLLLDEPFSNLDPIHKSVLKEVLEDISGEMKITCMLASHDPQDTLSWAGSMVVLQHGQLLRQDTPEALYRQPGTAYIAGLLGPFNAVPANAAERFSLQKNPEGPDQALFFRPKSVMLYPTNKFNSLLAKVQRCSFSGSHYELKLSVMGLPMLAHTTSRQYKAGDTVFVSVPPAAVTYLKKDVPAAD